MSNTRNLFYVAFFALILAIIPMPDLQAAELAPLQEGELIPFKNISTVTCFSAPKQPTSIFHAYKIKAPQFHITYRNFIEATVPKDKALVYDNRPGAKTVVFPGLNVNSVPPTTIHPPTPVFLSLNKTVKKVLLKNMYETEGILSIGFHLKIQVPCKVQLSSSQPE